MPESSDRGCPVGVGDVLHLRERDYRYGVGDLRLRVTVQPVESLEPGWMSVTGIQLLWNGRDGMQRHVEVPAAVLQDPRVRGLR